MMAEGSQKTEALNGEYDTGVSNGDVDWLFRGKSKKLTKKMNTTNLEKERKLPNSMEQASRDRRMSSVGSDNASKERRVSSEAAETVPGEQEAAIPKVSDGRKDSSSVLGPQTDKEADNAGAVKAHASPVHTSGSSGGAPEASVAATPNANTGNHVQSSSSVLDKLKIGRGRSSSASSVSSNTVSEGLSRTGSAHSQNSQNSKRRGSISFFSSESQSPQTSGEAGQQVQRPNSSNGKSRSLFSSLSSKFKSAPPLSTSNDTSSMPPPNSHSTSSPKFVNAFIGSAVATGYENQDLITSTNRLPLGFSGGSRRRSSSATSNSADSLSERDKGLFSRRKQSTQLCETSDKPGNSERIILNKNSKRESIPIKDLEGVKLRRVNFAIDKLEYDPQQQIPCRRPKRGNVLVPEDLISPIPRLSQGISISDGKKNTNTEPQYTEKELSIAFESQRKALVEADKHAQEAHLSAKRISSEVAQYKVKTQCTKQINEEDQEPEEEVHDMGKVEIDMPLHMHENHFENENEESEKEEEVTLETIYTRCCHLREILPIPATLKQLKNKTKPLQVLKLLNPKPTLIDVLSFSDFIAITPINTVIFDNVTVTTEMLKHILASLVYNKSLEKLSLRNVAIDELGWKYLCKFLSRNQTVKKLDISQQRIKSDTKVTCIRSSMNWDLLIESLILRGGIEELVINGCKLSDETFKRLIENAVILSTFRLGIASIELNCFKAKIVADWIADPNSKCVGVDVAFNDLSKGQLQPFIKSFEKGNSKFLFFSLHSTHLSDVDEANELLRALVNVKTLRFLDLSSLPDLFPGIISKLDKYLPQFKSLRRIHFDLNELSDKSMGAIANILPKVKGLLHVSFLGNKDIKHSAYGSLYTAVKLSKSLYALDLDYDLIPDDLSQRIAFYLMRNMDKTMNSEIASHNDNEEDLMFDGTLLMQTAEKLLVENDKHNDHSEDLKVQKIITNALIERTRAIRKDLHHAIDSLFEKRNLGVLSFDGKETLLRFCLLDASLEKLVHMFEEHAKSNSPLHGSDVLSPSNSVSSLNESSDAQNSVSIEKSKRNKNFLDKEVSLNFDNLHQSSSELITSGPILSPHNMSHMSTNQYPGYFHGIEQNFEPRQVVIESSSDGTKVPVDNLTGRPVLMRSSSQTSVHAKEQEKEEGEFHRWGYFIQQRSNSTERDNASKTEDDNKRKVDQKSKEDTSESKNFPVLNVLPSGSELRDAITAAKGIDSVRDLIDKINNDRVSLDGIYGMMEHPKSKGNPAAEDPKQAEINPDKAQPGNNGCNDCRKSPDETKDNDQDNESIDSGEGLDDEKSTCKCKNEVSVNAVVDESYDKLLNEAQRVRSNK